MREPCNNRLICLNKSITSNDMQMGSCSNPFDSLGRGVMFKLLAISAILAAAWQTAAADGARSALRTCIKTAATEAKAQKMASDALPDFIHQKCSAEELKFKSAVWSFDSKNKVSKKQSESDASLQIEDFVTSAADRYAMESSPQ
jgi:hypothetical protein